MSTKRHSKGIGQRNWGKPELDADGQPVCRWCKKVRPPKAGWRTFCSNNCVKEFKIRRSASSVRFYLRQREHGICQICSRDCDWMQKVVRWLIHTSSLLAYHGNRWTGSGWEPQPQAMLESKRRIEQMGQWQADHIVPVSEGGGECGLENYRTLCHECHAGETKRLRQRLAAKRNAERSKRSGSLFEIPTEMESR